MLKKQNAGRSKFEALEGLVLSIKMCVLKNNAMVNTDNFFRFIPLAVLKTWFSASHEYLEALRTAWRCKWRQCYLNDFHWFRQMTRLCTY